MKDFENNLDFAVKLGCLTVVIAVVFVTLICLILF